MMPKIMIQQCFKSKFEANNVITMKHNIILGAIAGDIIGSCYEWFSTKNIDFELFTRSSNFTDDTVMTVANADWLLTDDSLLGIMQEYGNKYPRVGYGGSFSRWLRSDDPQPYNSWGNGSAMRVSPVGWAFGTLEETLEAAKCSAEVTHNHPEGIKGAQAVAASVYLARNGRSKEEIKAYVEQTFGYDLSRTCNEIRPHYRFDVSCQGSVPESIIAFLESTDYESAVRLAVSLGGDADTMGAIAGGIAEAFYREIPDYICEEVLKRLPSEFTEVMKRFYAEFCDETKERQSQGWGKELCNVLKDIRKKIAVANGIDYEPTECKHQGDCYGTCPACEAEVRYLERELKRKQDRGEKILLQNLVKIEKKYDKIGKVDKRKGYFSNSLMGVPAERERFTAEEGA